MGWHVKALTSPIVDDWDWPAMWATHAPGQPLQRHHSRDKAEVAQALAPDGTRLLQWLNDAWQDTHPQRAPDLQAHDFAGLGPLCEACGRPRGHRLAHPGALPP